MTTSATPSLGYVAVYVLLVGVASFAEKPAGQARGAGLWRGRCTTSWLFCWLLRGGSIFEKARLPVGTAGFEPATP